MGDQIGSLGISTKEFDNPISNAIRELARFQTATNKAENALKMLEKKFKDSGNASKVYEKAVTNQRVVVSSLKDATKSATDNLARLRKVSSDGETGASGLTKAFGGLRNVLGAIGITVGLAGIVSFIKNTIANASQMRDTARSLGELPSTIEKVQLALGNDLKPEATISALQAINAAMVEAKNGSTEASDKLHMLGVSWDEIKTKSPTAVLVSIATAYQQNRDKADALRRLTNLFGNDIARLLIPALEKGGDALQNLIDRQSSAADENTELAREWETTWTRIEKSFQQGVVNSIGWLDKLREAVTGTPRGFDANAPVSFEDLKKNPSAGVSTTAGTQPPVNVKKSQENQAALLKKQLTEYLTEERKTPPPTPQSAHDDIASYDLRKDAAQIEKDSLETQTEAAKHIAPEYVKQMERLKGQEIEINARLKWASGLEYERLQNQLEVNHEAQRNVQLTTDLAEAEIGLSKSLAQRAVGYEAEMEIHRATLRYLDAQIAALDKVKDKERIAAAEAQKRQEVLAMFSESNRYQDELRAAHLQTVELQAQRDAQLGLVKQAEILAQFEQRIVDARRLGNTQLTKELEQQQELAMRRVQAERHDITPEQRRKAREEERIITRKARQQDRRDAEQEARSAASQYASNKSLLPHRINYPAGFIGPRLPSDVHGMGRGTDARMSPDYEFQFTKDARSSLSRGAYGSHLINEQLGKDRLAQKTEERKSYTQRQFELTKQSTDNLWVYLNKLLVDTSNLNS